MPKNRHFTFGDMQAQKAREQQLAKLRAMAKPAEAPQETSQATEGSESPQLADKVSATKPASARPKAAKNATSKPSPEKSPAKKAVGKKKAGKK